MVMAATAVHTQVTGQHAPCRFTASAIPAEWTVSEGRDAYLAENGFRVDDTEYDAWLALTVGELREKLDIPRAGLAKQPRRLHSTPPVASP